MIPRVAVRLHLQVLRSQLVHDARRVFMVARHHHHPVIAPGSRRDIGGADGGQVAELAVNLDDHLLGERP